MKGTSKKNWNDACRRVKRLLYCLEDNPPVRLFGNFKEQGFVALSCETHIMYEEVAKIPATKYFDNTDRCSIKTTKKELDRLCDMAKEQKRKVEHKVKGDTDNIYIDGVLVGEACKMKGYSHYLVFVALPRRF